MRVSCQKQVLRCNFENFENQVIDSFKFLKLNVDDFLRFFENKKDGWRYFNKNVASFMHMTYTANSLKTFNNSKNFEKDILNFIQNTSPFYNQQIVIPKDEFKRLKKKFLLLLNFVRIIMEI